MTSKWGSASCKHGQDHLSSAGAAGTATSKTRPSERLAWREAEGRARRLPTGAEPGSGRKTARAH
eukprot:8067701-Pyramimonas_sp.AAC.1